MRPFFVGVDATSLKAKPHAYSSLTALVMVRLCANSILNRFAIARHIDPTGFAVVRCCRRRCCLAMLVLNRRRVR